MGHKALEHRLSKQNGNRKDNVIENISKHVSGINFSAMVYVVHSNPREQWIDTSAIQHVCSDKEMFISFEPIGNGENLYMGNSAMFEIKTQKKMMTSGKT